jgi:hypothetical protein
MGNPAGNPNSASVKLPSQKGPAEVCGDCSDVLAGDGTGRPPDKHRVGRDESFNPDVPHITGAVARGIQSNDSEGRAICREFKQLEPDAAGVTAEEGEVDSGSIFMGSHRQRDPHPNFSALGNLSRVTVQRVFRLVFQEIERFLSPTPCRGRVFLAFIRIAPIVEID